MLSICGNCCIILSKIKWNPERVSNIKPFISYPSKIDHWKTFEKSNPKIAINILHIKEKKICPPYSSKINSNCEKQIILLTIPNEEKKVWHYLSLKKAIDII